MNNHKRFTSFIAFAIFFAILFTPVANSQEFELKINDCTGAPKFEEPILTQYALIDVTDFGPGIRDTDSLIKNLKENGFSIDFVAKEMPEDMDEMSKFVYLIARYTKNNHTTMLTAWTDEDSYVNIDFSNGDDADSFADSMRNLSYVEENGLFTHPMNYLSKIYVRKNGTNVKIISPFEMLPNNF